MVTVNGILTPQILLVSLLAGCLNREQQKILDYLQEENRVLGERLGERLHLSDEQRCRLAAKAKELGRKLLEEVAIPAVDDALESDAIQKVLHGIRRPAGFYQGQPVIAPIYDPKTGKPKKDRKGELVMAPVKIREFPTALHITVAHNNLLPLENRFDLLDLEGEIVPGIQAMAAPGHTPGHMCLVISSGDEELMYTSDVALHPIHVEQIEWYSAVDLVPERALASRHRFLEKAAAERALVHGYHFPWPGLGHVSRVGDAFQWRPVK
jgi:hypothetical protein